MCFLIRIASGIGSSNDFDRMRTISWHFGVCLPMKMTSLVCHQLRRARTEGLPIGDGLYGFSDITPSLLQVGSWLRRRSTSCRLGGAISSAQSLLRAPSEGKRVQATTSAQSASGLCLRSPDD